MDVFAVVEVSECVTGVSQSKATPLEYSDDEISTKKQMHWRLGPEDHDDTLPFDFPVGYVDRHEKTGNSSEDDISCLIHRSGVDKPSVG